MPGKLPQWDGEAATLCAYDGSLHPYMPHAVAGSSISGDVTPVSLASELEFNSNEATAGSITDHDLLSAEGEDDEETLSVDPGDATVKLIRNDLSPSSDACAPSTSNSSTAPSFYGLDAHMTKENFYKDMPSSSKNYNIDVDINKCTKDDASNFYHVDPMQSKNDSKSVNKTDETLNNGSRRYSDSSAQKSNVGSQASVAGSRFTTTLVAEDMISTSSKSNNNLTNLAEVDPDAPLVTKAKSVTVKPGFTIFEDRSK